MPRGPTTYTCFDHRDASPRAVPLHALNPIIEPAAPDDEVPDLESRSTFPRDVLSYVYALPAFLLVGCLSAGFVGIAAFLVIAALASDGSLSIGGDPSSRLIPAAFVGGLASVVVLYFWARMHFEVSKKSARFYGDRIVAVVQAPGGGRNYELVTAPYDRVGTVLCLSRDEVEIFFHPPSQTGRASLCARFSALSIEDEFDRIVELIGNHPRTRPLASEVRGRIEYTRAWQPDEMLPDARPVSGRVTVNRIGSETGTTLRLPHRRWTFTFGPRFGVFVEPSSRTDLPEDPPESDPEVVLGSSWDADRNLVRFFGTGGLLVAWSPTYLENGILTLRLGWDAVLDLHLETGALRLDGDRIGSLFRDGEQVVLEAEKPIHEFAVLILFSMARTVAAGLHAHSGRARQLPVAPSEASRSR